MERKYFVSFEEDKKRVEEMRRLCCKMWDLRDDMIGVFSHEMITKANNFMSAMYHEMHELSDKMLCDEPMTFAAICKYADKREVL